MIKSVLTSSYDFGSPVARIIGVTGRGLDRQHLSKAAASAGLFKDVDVHPEKDKAVLHIIAMSAAPFYPANKNGDVFFDTNREVELRIPGAPPIQLGRGLKETYKTFETDAKVYKEHFNTKTDKVYGDVLKAGYNDDMHRIELLLSLPVDEWQQELSGIERGEDAGFSMSTRLPEDMCNCCGHRASKRDDYCNHLKYELGQIRPDGHLVAAINDENTFFDISGVRNPADRIAFCLMKAASQQVVGGAQLAEMLNIPSDGLDLRSKYAEVLRKLAAMEKTIETAAVAPANDAINRAAASSDLTDSTLGCLKSANLSSEQILGCLSDAKVVVSLKDFMKILMGPQFETVEPLIGGAEDRLPGVFSRMCVDPRVQDGAINLPSTPVPSMLRSLLGDLQESHGMDDGAMRRRVTVITIKGCPTTRMKSAAVKPDAGAEELVAQLYGQYKAAFCYKHLADNGLTFCSVLGHYIDHK